MNPLYAVGFILLGIISIVVILFIMLWSINRKKRLPPRYVRETQRWLWLMNKKPLVVWSERSSNHKFKWKDWDMCTAYYSGMEGSRHRPEPGDVIIVDGRYSTKYIFVVTDNNNNNIESCYLGLQYE